MFREPENSYGMRAPYEVNPDTNSLETSRTVHTEALRGKRETDQEGERGSQRGGGKLFVNGTGRWQP